MKNLLPLGSFVVCLACSPILPLENPFENAEGPPSTTEARPRPLRIEILDVGQGDATLVIGPDGSAMLIDSGKPGEGAAAVLPALETLGIDRLDWIVATHYDADHIGGISEVLNGPDQVSETDDDVIPSQAVFDRGDATDKATETYEDYVRTAGPYRETAAPGMVFPLGDGAEAKIVVANGRYEDGREIALEAGEENEASIGLLITYGGFRYFTAGDLTGGGSPGGFETKDLETFAGEIIGDIDVLHAGHHGSESSSNLVFLEKTRPEAVVISVGTDNDYGHPAPSALLRMEDIDAAIYRTDQMGSLEIITDGKGYEIDALRKD